MDANLVWKFIEAVIAILVCYIGYQQTKKYREDDKRDKLKDQLDSTYRSEIKQSITDIKDTVFFMFDNHGHEILCDNEDCKKPRTGKVFIAPPQQNRGA